MAGLQLLNTYSSGSENSDTDDDKDKKILPLPASIASWTGIPYHEEVVDDPLMHNGRKRVFQHERGNWATLVYVDYIPSTAMLSWMNSILIHMPNKGNILFEQFHISLTRTLILKYHWIQSFVDSLKILCRKTERFSLELQDVAVYMNEEKSRTFLGICCRNTTNVLDSFTKGLDTVLAEYDLPSFYQNASYHISFIWGLGDQKKSLEQVLPSFSTSLLNFLADNIEDSIINIDKFYCKIGNKLYTFGLGQ